MVITNSIFKAFLECPARALAVYKPRMMEDATIVPDWDDKGSESMACGSLVDAIVTRGLNVEENGRKSVAELALHLKSSYDDGTKNADWLLNKNGTFSAQAQTAIRAARRLLEDETFAELMRGNVKNQSRLRFNLFDDVYWEGDIDILCDEDDRHHIIDLKAPASIEDQWITVKGKNDKVKWYDAWSYWFQLAGYSFGLDLAKGATLNGAPCGEIGKPFLSKLGIVFTTRSKVPQIGYVPIANHWLLWERIVLGREGGLQWSKAETIANIARGLVEAPGCGKCDYCASKSKLVITEPTEEPKIDDIFGLNV